MARSGGTLICRCLGSMENIILLSEVHPNFSLPQLNVDILEQAYKWFNLLEYKEIQQIRGNGKPNFPYTISLIHSRCLNRGKTLVLRDWSHIDFTAAPYLPKASYTLTTAEVLENMFSIIHTAIVRHPIDQWLSLMKLPDVNGTISLELFLRGYYEFAVQCLKIGYLKYEIFIKDTETQLKLLCSRLDLDFDKRYVERWSDYKIITGDIWGFGRGSNKIISLPHRKIHSELIKIFEQNTDYHLSLEILGYQHPKGETLSEYLEEQCIDPSASTNSNNRKIFQNNMFDELHYKPDDGSERLDVNCPHCKENIYVSHKGNWICPCCSNSFLC